MIFRLSMMRFCLRCLNQKETGFVMYATGRQILRLMSTSTLNVEAKHLVSKGYDCRICNKFCKTLNALKLHESRYHRGLNKMAIAPILQ